MTKEHIWPQMWQDFLPESGEKRFGYNQSVFWSDKQKNWTTQSENQYARPGGMKHYAVRRICKRCNGGWVRQLQEAITDRIKVIASGDDFTVEPEMQAKIALWASVFVSSVDTVGEDDTRICQADRTYIYRERKIPPHWVAFLGRRAGDGSWASTRFDRRAVSYEPVEGQGKPTLQQITMSVGYGIFSVFSKTNDEQNFGTERFQRRYDLLKLSSSSDTRQNSPTRILNEQECSRMAIELLEFFQAVIRGSS